MHDDDLLPPAYEDTSRVRTAREATVATLDELISRYPTSENKNRNQRTDSFTSWNQNFTQTGGGVQPAHSRRHRASW
ncbi:hypothetical protein ACFY2W_26815 [Streptomyces sp. NPDC001262]|uniref:hypothetical protein n=1 Tax=Streptomyces TaxID=1883 RepID=UPI0036C13CEC